MKQKLNEYFYPNQRGRYDLYRLDNSKGFFRHIQEMNYQEFTAYQGENNCPVRFSLI